ncbi:MAG: sensor histidine kinase [Gemmatimonadaceae bacterium]
MRASLVPALLPVTIRSKLALGLFAIAVALLLPLVFALRSMERLHAAMVDLRNREFAASLLLGELRSSAEEVRRVENALLFVRDSASLRSMHDELERLALRTAGLHRFDLGAAAAEIDSTVAVLIRLAPLEFGAALAGNTVTADSISTRHFLPGVRRVERVLNGTERALRERTSARVQEAADETARARNAAAIALAVAGTLALIIAVVLWRSISRPVRDLEAGMAAVADGNFAHRLSVSPRRRDEFGRLATSFRTMADQLAQLDRLRAEFISVASHELKTPVNVILGYLQLIDDGVYGTISPKQREILRTLDAQTRSLSRLVHQLLDVSRFEAGAGKLDLRPIDLEEFLGELEDTFRVLSLQRGIDFQIDRSGVLPDEVLWDPDRINEVLGNLLSNAFKFTGRGGSIELAIEGAGDELHITVRDSGAGIPASQLPHIFEKFYQADNQGAATQGGSGLGLAIAKQIVTLHHGTIRVDSTVGVGTTFSITLPVRALGRASGRQRPIPVGVES